MLTIHELLQDKAYKEFFLKKPAMPTVYRHQGLKPWRVYVQRTTDGPWAKKDCSTYSEAFTFFKKYLPKVHDAAIVSRAVAFAPPHRLVRIKGRYRTDRKGKTTQVVKLKVWQPKVPPEEQQHRWCYYCRRPTVFRYFSKHHAFTGQETFNLDAQERCTICGMRLEGQPRLLRGVK